MPFIEVAVLALLGDVVAAGKDALGTAPVEAGELVGTVVAPAAAAAAA